jgi:6-hydroxynicotinate 3-monooxygenase
MVNFKNLSIAVVGAGLGGTTTAALLQKKGFPVTVYEQAETFKKLGAGIHLSPSLLKVLDSIGVKDELVAKGATPKLWMSRNLTDNKLLFALPLGDSALSQYNSPYLTVHRGDFHSILMNAVEPGTVQFNKRLASIENAEQGKKLSFEDGTEVVADLVIGADGLRSKVRASFCGNEVPTFGKQIVFRGQSPISKVNLPGRFELTKWWDESRFVVSYFMEETPQTIYFVAGFPAESWDHKEGFIPASRDMIVDRFKDTCESVVELVSAAEDLSLWPIYEREPISEWGTDGVVLLGDACHPMRPHMAQGAAMAIEDAALLVRLLESGEYQNLTEVQANYCRLRLPRTSKVQKISSENVWLKEPTDPDWLYGYDAMSCDLGLNRIA